MQYGEAEADGHRPLLEDANSSDEDDAVDGGVGAKAKGASISFRQLEANDGIHESQWALAKVRTPWSTIIFSFVLFLAGTVSEHL